MLRDYRNSAIMVLVGLAASYLVVAGGTFDGTSRRAVIAGALDPLVGSFGRAPVLAVVWVLVLVAAWKMWPRRGHSQSGAAMAEPVAGERDDLAAVQNRLQRLDRFKAAEHGDVSGVLTRQPEPTADIPAKRPAESPGDEDVSQVVERARRRPIVFRETYPPWMDGGLSFYGGRPVGPGDMSWPRGETKNGEGPLHFVMQWDCAELAPQDPSGLLPHEGALYLFCDLEWGTPLAFRFVHVEGPTSGWAPLAVPHDLGPVYGSQGAWLIKHCSAKVPPEQQGVPRLLPKWPFRPVSFDMPATDGDGEAEDEEADGRFWHQSARVKQVLLEVQDSLGSPLATFEPGKKAPPFGRPFPSFPHDWAAVRRVTVEAIERLQRPEDLGPGFLPDATEEEPGETVARWLQEANELHAFAVAQPAEAVVPPQTADDIWAWIESIKPAIRLGFSRLAEESVNASLGLESQARAAIPREPVDANSVQHSLAHAFVREEYPPWGQPDAMEAFKARQERGELATVRDIHSPTPNHMFGPPSYVQGAAEEHVHDWLLLLELSSHEAIGHLCGEGVIQFLIRPADLRDRRFEAVEAILSAY